MEEQKKESSFSSKFLKPARTLFKQKPYILAVIAVLIVGCILAYILVSSDSSAQKISAKLVNAVIDGRINDAYKLTGTSFRSASTFSELTNAVNQISTYTKGGKVSLADSYTQSNGEQAGATSIVYSVTKDKTYYIRVILEKEGDDWKVVNFRASETALKAQDD